CPAGPGARTATHQPLAGEPRAHRLDGGGGAWRGRLRDAGLIGVSPATAAIARVAGARRATTLRAVSDAARLIPRPFAKGNLPVLIAFVVLYMAVTIAIG